MSRRAPRVDAWERENRAAYNESITRAMRDLRRARTVAGHMKDEARGAAVGKAISELSPTLFAKQRDEAFMLLEDARATIEGDPSHAQLMKAADKIREALARLDPAGGG